MDLRHPGTARPRTDAAHYTPCDKEEGEHAPGATVMSLESADHPPTLALQKQVVLIVDDEPEIRATLSATFRRALPEVEVVTAESGEAGLRVLRDRLFDLVLSDHCMPGMAGLDFLAQARDLQPESVRVLMTAHPEMDLAVRGVNDRILQRFLTKPFRPKEVVAVVHDLLGESRGRILQKQGFQRTLSLLQRMGADDPGATRGG